MGDIVEKHHLLFVLPLVACTNASQGSSDASADGIGSVTLDGGGSDAAGSGASSADGGSGAVDGTSDGGVKTKYDVGVGEFCDNRAADVYCTDQNKAMQCDGAGNLVDSEDCDPDYCVPGQGCVVCLDGQFTCMAEKVMQCNTGVSPPVWQLYASCNPAGGEVCDISIPGCTVQPPVGTTTPTGEYYQFADFHMTGVFLGGYDVDGYGDKLFVLGYNGGVDEYSVQLLDSDMDGLIEPNQHPSNPDMPGPIEERVLTFVQTIPIFGTPSLSSSELFALAEDHLFMGGSQITENILGVGTSVAASPPAWDGHFAHLGYDEVRGVWYASNESYRRVLQYDANTATWGIAFNYPPLAGDHMDGMEVVVDPNTGIPYVYVSDMTSDFLGQYRFHPEMGWIQENLFSYVGTAGVVLEGMGFGPLNHFWATGGESVYEIGGGDLSKYTDPPG